jgi:hypothetical protein
MVELGNQKRLGLPDRSCSASVNKGADGRTYPNVWFATGTQLAEAWSAAPYAHRPE